MRRPRGLLVAIVAASNLVACQRNPAGPGAGPLTAGRWMTETGVCLTITETTCSLVAGCGHGQFPQPIVRVDGTFDVDGTYRIEVGPVSIDPAPSAHFSGLVSDSRLILNVAPSGSLPSATYSMTPTSAGTCSLQCLALPTLKIRPRSND